jgi:enoyl-CoA hydratase
LSEDLLYEKKDGVAYVTFNRPEKRNAITPEMMVRLAEAWEDYRDDDEMRCAILTGAGDQSFTAGADLTTVIPLLTKAKEPENEWEEKFMSNPMGIGGIALLTDFELYKPVIVAVNGSALGGGTEILHPCDIRLAAPHVMFGLSEVKRALFPGASIARLPRHIPYCKAMEILLVGDGITAEEAHRIGLINYVVPSEQLMDTAREFAEKIAENGPVSVRKIKEGVIRTSGLTLPEARQIEKELAREVGKTQDAREGPRAFMEKRKPVYKGM